MVKNALGLIEVVGLAAGIEAADAAVKAANIELLGYELTKGGGMVVVKLCGDVGAVKAAIEAAAASAAKVGKVYATHVIPRPHSELAGMVETIDTVGRTTCSESPALVEPAAGSLIDIEPTVFEQAPEETGIECLGHPVEEIPAKAFIPGDMPAAADPAKKAADLCNLCGDPECPRKKGDPKVTCIHYDKNNREDE